MPNLRSHNKDNYQVAKKVQIFVRRQGSTDPADWLSLGSVLNVQPVTEETPLEHFTTYLGERGRDRVETIERRRRITFSLEELNVPNLKLAMGRGFRSSSSGTKDRKHDKTVQNPGAGGTISLGVTDIKNLLLRSVGLEASETFEALSFSVSDEVAESDDFNNTDSPLEVTGAVATYADVVFAVGKLFRLGTEILRVTAIDGEDVTFARAQLGTVNAVHADGVEIEEGSGDYSANLTTGVVTILWTGDLDDEEMVPKIHGFFEEELDVEEFEVFDGDPIECELQYQWGGRVEGPYQNVLLRPDGPPEIGDGSDWIRIPMVAEILVGRDGSFGTIGIEKETQS